MGKTVVILVHGYNVVNPEKTVGKLRPYFEDLGCLVESFTYGYVPFTWQITRRNPALAKKLAGRCHHWELRGYRVYLAAHSNGCTIAQLSVKNHGAKIHRLLAFHPALEKRMHPCTSAEVVLVIHNQGDKAVVVGKWIGRLFRWLTPKSKQARPWGEMGQDGYTGSNPKVLNIDTGDATQFDPTAHGHSEEFSKKKAGYFLPMFTKKVFSFNQNSEA